MWRTLRSSLSHAIDCRVTFLNGQCFGWKEPVEGVFTSVMRNKQTNDHFLVSLRNLPELKGVEYYVHSKSAGTKRRSEAKMKETIEQELTDYLQLSHDMAALADEWSNKGDTRVRVIWDHLPGLRILRQDVVECLFSFICSSNNNIKRITQILDKLRRSYGRYTEKAYGIEFYSFPELEDLAAATETELRELGLGYRAGFVVKSVKKIMECGGREYLEGLRNKDRETVAEELTKLDGVGRKVADCVALFCLDKTDCIPVDTHVWAIACRDLDSDLRQAKSLTPKIYNYVGELFRQKYGGYCGWAHSLMFAAELDPFRKRLPEWMQKEMAKFAEEEKQLRAAKKRGRDQNKSPSPGENPKKSNKESTK